MLTRLALVLGLLGGAAESALADHLALLPEGLKHLEEIEKAVAPATIEDVHLPGMPAALGQKRIHCLLLEAHPGDGTEPVESVAGQPSYTVICFDRAGTNVSSPVRLSSLWVLPVVTAGNSFLGLRRLFSNRDELHGTRIGSPQYVAGFLRALGIESQGDLAPPADTEALVPGALELWLQGKSDSVKERADALAARFEQRLPWITYSMPPEGSDLYGAMLLHPIAQARRYGLHESGFDRAAMRLLVMRLEFVGVDGTTPLAKRVNKDGAHSFQALRSAIVQASPQFETHIQMQEHGPALDAIRASSADEVVVAKKLDEYWRQHGHGVTNDNSSPADDPLPVDPSEIASVALDALLVSDAVFLISNERKRVLVEDLQRFGIDIGYDFRMHDAVDARPKGVRLMHRLMDPDAPSQRVPRETVAASAEIYRTLFRSLARQHIGYATGSDSPIAAIGTWRYFLALMQTIGWAADDDFLYWVRTTCKQASTLAGRVASGEVDLERRFELTMQKLSDLYALKAVEGTAEQAISQVVEAYVAEIRKQEPNETATVFLRHWESLRGR